MAATALLCLLAAITGILAEVKMQFTRWPESATAPAGDAVTFECAVRVPGERLVWRWRELRDGAPWVDVLEPYDADGVSTRLVVDVKESTKPGYYQCVVWYGAVILASVPARLSVARLDASLNRAERRVLTAAEGDELALHCRPPRSDPPAVLRWWKEDQGKKTPLEAPHGVLHIRAAAAGDSGVYRCSASNELSGQTTELPERTVLRVQPPDHGDVRFLETEEYVGTVVDGALTAPVRPGAPLRLHCGAVGGGGGGGGARGAAWTREGAPLPARAKVDGQQLTIAAVKAQDAGVYTCSVGPARRSWRVVPLTPAHWRGSVSDVNATEGEGARVSCGAPLGAPPIKVHWLMNGQPVTADPLIRATNSELHIRRVQKRHASIVQCFACNAAGCAYDAALLTVVPVQISDQEYNFETGRAHFPAQAHKRHNRKNSRKPDYNKPKAVLIPPSSPNVTRMADDSVMVTWTNSSEGLPIQFFKIQYREANNKHNGSQQPAKDWNTCSQIIPPYIHTHQISGLTPDRSYKFRISAVYSNQDNKSGDKSGKFHLQRGAPPAPRAPALARAAPLSPYSIMINWTYTQSTAPQAEGFYIYYRAISSAGEYVKVTAVGAAARSLAVDHLAPDTGYEFKVRAYTALAPSDFSSILTAKTHRLAAPRAPPPPTPPPPPADAARGALLPAAGAAGAGLTALLLAVALCRRRPSAKEKAAAPEGGGGAYLPAKVPLTITANPMHAEGGDSGVEMSYMHNNNTGSDESNLSLTRKNGGANRQYV